MRSFRLASFALLAGAAGLAAIPAHAGVVVSYPDFSNTAGLTLVGNAATATTGDGTVLRVAPASSGQSGAAYSTTPVTLGGGDTFSTTFQFRFTNTGGIDPADGIAFVLAASPGGLGSVGQGLGYAGVPNSAAIEFDTFDNGASDGNNSNHVALDTGGNLNEIAVGSPYGATTCDFGSGNTGLGCMSNGDKWTVRIGYDGTNLTTIVQDAANPADTAISNYAIDLASVLGTSNAYVGFTGSTGAGWENHDILNWQFADTTQLVATPEPGSLALFCLAVGGLGLLRRRRV